jgi:hypothetical protein
MNGDLYFKFWSRFLGSDLRNLRTGRVYTKGQASRLFPSLAESLALGDPLPSDWETVARPPFVPYVERAGKIFEKKSLLNTIKEQ